jgi:hypothetical protein
MNSTLHRKSAVWIVAIGGLAIGLFVFWIHVKKSRQLNFAPDGLAISNVLYEREESWGFGPGGNETGVIVYELPESVADQIEEDGTAYLSELSEHRTVSKSANVHRTYNGWAQTPVQLEGSDIDANRTFSYDIDEFLNRYGFGLDINEQIRNEINEAISKPGSFVAYGRSGIVIVIPHTRRLVYTYRG